MLLLLGAFLTHLKSTSHLILIQRYTDLQPTANSYWLWNVFERFASQILPLYPTKRQTGFDHIPLTYFRKSHVLNPNVVDYEIPQKWLLVLYLHCVRFTWEITYTMLYYGGRKLHRTFASRSEVKGINQKQYTDAL